MSQDTESVVEPIRKAVRKAHDDFQALQMAVGRASMLTPLLFAGTALDRLLMTIDLISSSTSNFKNDLLYRVFDAGVGADIQLSHAIMRDMTTVAEHLRHMTPSTSPNAMMPMEEHHCQNIANMVDRYDRAISSLLIHHNTVLMQRRYSLDSLVSQTHAIFDGIDGIGKQLEQQKVSAVVEMRSSMA
jgi:hypothetical protein